MLKAKVLLFLNNIMPEKKLQSAPYFKNIIWVATGFLITLLIFLLIKTGIRESYCTLITFSLTCFLFLYSINNRKKYEKQITKIVGGILIFLIVYFIYRLFITYLRIPQWDYLCFYLFGHIGTSGLNFYDPHAFFQVFNELNLHTRVDSSFIPEIVNVGFWYPPPSMFLYLPLGILDLYSGYYIWQTILILFLIADICLLLKYHLFKIHSTFNKSITSFLFIILLLLFPGFISPIESSQTLTIFLFLLILLIRYLDNWKSGVFLVLLIVIKPLAAIFALYFLLFKKWKILFSSLMTGLVIVAVSIIFFGYNSFLDFLISPPTNRIPITVLYESANQYLDAVLSRVQYRISGFVNYETIKTATLILSVIIVAITLYFSRLLFKKSHVLSFMIFLPMTLLIYPNTGFTYVLILIPVFLYLFNQKPFEDNALNFVLLFILYSIGYYSLFLLDLVLWIILILWSLPHSYNYLLTLGLVKVKASLFSKRMG